MFAHVSSDLSYHFHHKHDDNRNLSALVKSESGVQEQFSDGNPMIQSLHHCGEGSNVSTTPQKSCRSFCAVFVSCSLCPAFSDWRSHYPTSMIVLLKIREGVAPHVWHLSGVVVLVRGHLVRWKVNLIPEFCSLQILIDSLHIFTCCNVVFG